MFIFSCKNFNITTHCWAIIDRRMFDPTKKKDTPGPRAKEEPQQDGRRGKIMFKIKPHNRPRCLEGSNNTLCAPGPRDPMGTKPDPLFSSGLLQGQRLWVQLPKSHSLRHMPSLLEEVAINPTIEPLSGRPRLQNNYTKEILAPLRTHNSFPNLGSWQRDWQLPENLTLEASGIWLQNLHRTGETDSWRAQTKSCAHQSRRKEQGPHKRLTQTCLWVSQESPEEAWVSCGLRQGQGHWVGQFMHRIFSRRPPSSSLPPP